ncbi:MAG: PAS domain-containing sensor histidine kinase [Dehalococcoidia bacterium]|nr:PAS domain-containing sensor histidine kinase [Dehalococcoidia bacterium]
MKAEFLRSLEEMRGVHFVFQDEKLVYSRFDTASSGYATRDVIGLPFTYAIAPECREEVLKINRDLLKGRDKSIAYYNTLALAKDGSRVPVRCAVWATMYQDKPAVAGVMARITDEDQAASLARETTSDYRLLSKSASKAGEGIIAFEKGNQEQLSCIYANEEIERLSGHFADDILGMKIKDLFSNEIICEQPGTPLRYESEVFKKGGGTTPVEICLGMATLHPKRQVTIVYVRDITERKRWEAANLKLQQSLRFYARQVIKAQEKERKRLSRDLHDSTIQSLISIYNRLQDINGRCPEGFGDLCEVIENALIDLRTFTWNLRPPLLDDMGLAPTLRWLTANTLRSSGLKVEVCITGRERRLPDNVELSVFRIAQEAINNVHRHAKASVAKVSLDFGEEWITLSIRDNGCGFKVPARLTSLANKGKLGLIGMNERSMDIGADIHIRSQKGKGSIVLVAIPMSGSA